MRIDAAPRSLQDEGTQLYTATEKINIQHNKLRFSEEKRLSVCLSVEVKSFLPVININLTLLKTQMKKKKKKRHLTGFALPSAKN